MSRLIGVPLVASFSLKRTRQRRYHARMNRAASPSDARANMLRENGRATGAVYRSNGLEGGGCAGGVADGDEVGLVLDGIAHKVELRRGPVVILRRLAV